MLSLFSGTGYPVAIKMVLKRALMETDLEQLKDLVKKWEHFEWIEVPGLEDRLSRLKVELNSAGFDRWGLHPETLRKFAPMLYLLYHKYFRVETSGVSGIPEGRVLFIGNHGGQIPLDAMMAGLALFMDGEPPRIARAMVERWVPTVPFISTLFTRIGAMVGDPMNCRELLEHDQSVLVFPEGVRGSGKLFKDRYQLQRFGTGFMRLALETKTPIVPVAIIGTEETYPSVYNFEVLAKILGAPYFPITPFFPLLGPLGLIPLPSKVTVRFGEPMYFEGNGKEEEEKIREKVQRVKDALQGEINSGLKIRGEHIFTGAAK
ncbi:MAG: acyltransferase family protein [Bdellovibrionales bacterium]|nr:acyltransferase family protein [Bdellovibrionales bacterium]